MSANPELRRYLWTEFSANRLLIGPLLLIVLFATSIAVDWSLVRYSPLGISFPITATVSHWAYFAIVLLWGGRQAAGAVIREIRDGTWDAQRMSALGPWTMTLGKLIGATSYSWALGLTCLAIYTGVLAPSAGLGPALVATATMIGYGLVGQTVGLLVSLTRLSRTPGFRPANITLIHIIALTATGALYLTARIPDWLEIEWYGLNIAGEPFVVLTGWFFALWGVVGINRRMRRELHFRNQPWVWLVFLAFFAAYANGMAHRIGLPGAHLVITFVSVALFVYLLILFEPKDPKRSRRVAGMLRDRQDAEALSTMPLWPVTFIVLTLVTVVGVVMVAAGAVDGGRAFEGLSPRRFLIVHLAASYLFVVRDVLIVLAFGLSRHSREGVAIAFIVLVVIYGALPGILMAGRFFDVLPIFWPIATRDWPLALGPVAGQAAVAALVLWWRWRAYWRYSRTGPVA